MPLPAWNDDWEKPNLLRGRRGWAWSHYASLGVGAALAAVALGLSVPAVGRVRESDSRVRTIDEVRQWQLGVAVLESVQQK
jgi:hypothetical protein